MQLNHREEAWSQLSWFGRMGEQYIVSGKTQMSLICYSVNSCCFCDFDSSSTNFLLHEVVSSKD
jgi:hypothetical protein